MSGPKLLDQALALAALGWPVFPCSPQTKAPLLGNDMDEAGKPIPRTGGVKKASTDEATIWGWWKRWPKALIGVATGHKRLFVVDFDPRVDDGTGEAFTLERLKSELETQMGCQLPASLTSITQSGGVHIWLTWPEDSGEPIRNRGNLPLHVDVRGLGGYVIAPPSVMASGRDYHWLRRDGEVHDPSRTRIAEAPAALIEILRSKTAPARKPAKLPTGSHRRGAGGARGEAGERYALSALADECSRVAGAPSGERNATLNTAAFNVAQLVGAGALSTDVARAALASAAARNPGNDSPAQLDATIESGWQAGLSQPRDLSAVKSRSAASHTREPHGEDAPARSPDIDRELCLRPMTDLGNAERFARRFGDRVRFVDRLGWMAYDGRSFIFDGAGAMIGAMVHATVRAMRDEAAAMRESGRRDLGEVDALDMLVDTKRDGTEVLLSDKLDAWARASESAAKLSCIPTIARDLGGYGLTIQPEQLDSNPFLINVRNGTLELTYEPDAPEPYAELNLRPHDPRDLITRVAPVDYKPTARCPEYDRFLARVQPDATMRAFLHRWGGLSLTGDISEQKLAFHYGGGSNGKSTLVDCWAGIAGTYAGTVPIETFLDQGRKKKGSDASPDLAALVGVRMLRTSEPEKGSKLAEALIKLATGGEPMSVRKLNRDPFDLTPAFKMTISGNHRPSISGVDDGIWRRVMLVPWDVSIPDSEKDRRLMHKLREESSGILNRLLDGLIDWRVNGLQEPRSVMSATAEYREASDPMGRFLAACTRREAGERVASSALYGLFVAWAKAAGEREWTQVGFSKAMADRGYRKIESHGMKWVDIVMTRDAASFDVAGPSDDWEDDVGYP